MTPVGDWWPLALVVHRNSARLEISFASGEVFNLPAALLRAMTPSAADRGHGAPRDQPLSADFSGVGLLDARAVGAYAVRLVFDDGHDTGIYTWEMLHQLGVDKPQLVADHPRFSDR